MIFHFIVTCVSQKGAKKSHSILDLPTPAGDVGQVFQQWRSMIEAGNLKRLPAKDLYKGQLWNAFMECWDLAKVKIPSSRLWVISAGYGLISADERIAPYDITFQEPKKGLPSVLAKIACAEEPGEKKKLLQKWWKSLSSLPKEGPQSLVELVQGASSEDRFLFVISKDYLDAVQTDLKEAIWAAPHPNQILVVSNNPGGKLHRVLGDSWLYADSRFSNLPGVNSTTINAKIAHEVLRHSLNGGGGLKEWDPDAISIFLRNLAAGLPDAKKFDRETGSDEEIEEHIREELIKSELPFSKLHRAYRDSGRACEYSRFQGLFNKVKEELKQETSKKRPYLPVSYKPRKAKMLFFLPDWDDRVDPLYDFEKDIPTPNRDPYNHDAYHYELYGSLNCDGILVSKSVLEDNAQKKLLVSNLGVHKYLRLPKGVPVFGDCGAFNYIMEEIPPYETQETLLYYHELGFDLGVSIDHLIVPGILKKSKYYKEINNKWIEINKEAFDTLKLNPRVVIRNKRGSLHQPGLFGEGPSIAEESHIDEKERQRRYELTIRNAKDFILGHRKKGFSYTPIGAAQGWDPDSYARCFIEYQNMGYDYIALGGLVRSPTREILEVLEAVNKIRKKGIRVHIFGVARMDALESFVSMGVTSVDNAGVLRQAWLSSTNNFYSPDNKNYTAIRVPPVEGKIKRTPSGPSITEKKLFEKEQECLFALRAYDKGKILLKDALHAALVYDKVTGGTGKFKEQYKRTLLDKPWESCQCRLCKETGIDIIIFRRNNRNRRRGFHNTWVFFNKFKELTDIK